jgi:hypothetical protein
MVWSVHITLTDSSVGDGGVQGGVGPAPCIGDVAGVESLRRSRVSLVMQQLLGDVMRTVYWFLVDANM